jgi:hypothetical protein
MRCPAGRTRPSTKLVIVRNGCCSGEQHSMRNAVGSCTSRPWCQTRKLSRRAGPTPTFSSRRSREGCPYELQLRTRERQLLSLPARFSRVRLDRNISSAAT